MILSPIHVTASSTDDENDPNYQAGKGSGPAQTTQMTALPVPVVLVHGLWGIRVALRLLKLTSKAEQHRSVL